MGSQSRGHERAVLRQGRREGVKRGEPGDLLDDVGLTRHVEATKRRHRDVEAAGVLGDAEAERPEHAPRFPVAHGDSLGSQKQRQVVRKHAEQMRHGKRS